MEHESAATLLSRLVGDLRRAGPQRSRTREGRALRIDDARQGRSRALIGAVATLLAGSLALVAALILGLAKVMEPWLAALIVGVAITGVGLFLLQAATEEVVAAAPGNRPHTRRRAPRRTKCLRGEPDECHVGTTGREPRSRTAGACAERIRADLDRTLDALERKLSPSQLLDRSLAYLREHGGDMAVALGDSVRRNPVPILLTVAGLGWLIVSSVRTRDPIDVTPIDDADRRHADRRAS